MTDAGTDHTFAFFDLDDTLLDGDSDYLWGEFLCEEALVDAKQHRRENARYLEQYRDGTLDLREFLEFQLRPLTGQPMATLHARRETFLGRHIRPRLFERGREIIESHRSAGRPPVIVTATNRFITEPVALALGVQHLLATEPEVVAGRYSGRVAGQPCSGAGKVAHVRQWLEARGCRAHDVLARSWFYSDSYNDLPLLEAVQHAVAVNPDARLELHARSRGWPCLAFRDEVRAGSSGGANRIHS